MSAAYVEGRYDGSCGFIYTPSGGRCFFKIEINSGQATMTFHNQSIPRAEGSLVGPAAREYLERWVAAQRKETTT